MYDKRFARIMLFRHAIIILLALFVSLGVPALILTGGGIGNGGGADAVTAASLELPEMPSGNFIILLNRERHGKTLESWRLFFEEQPVDVIMEDIACMVITGDAAGIRMAERFQARLAENQMKWRRENGLLVASRTENGLFDVVILSEEAARAYNLNRDHLSNLDWDVRRNMEIIPVEGAVIPS